MSGSGYEVVAHIALMKLISFFARLHFAYKYGSSSASDALLASANAGGENVHRNEARSESCQSTLLLAMTSGVRSSSWSISG